jgi:hypothetical protein
MEKLITKAKINYGIGDALNARAFLMAYVRQRHLKPSSIIVYTDKYRWMFENCGFKIISLKNRFLRLVPYRNFGEYDLPKKFNENKLDLNIAKNAGITFSFDTIEPLHEYPMPLVKLPDRFITFNTGYGILSGKPKESGYICTKAWPIEYWEKLIDLINIPCVQVGSGPSCIKAKNAAVDLVDRLTITESAAVMRHGLFHVDIEGGLAILNQHLGKKSVVLFGPTAIENQGRSFNLNLRAETCTPCYEWGSYKYKSLSILKKDLDCNAHCMTDLKPEYVVEQIYKNHWL